MKKIILAFLVLSSILSAKVLELSATVISDNEKFITSRFMGFVKDLRVSEGSIVKKNQVLYTIDTTDIDAKKQQAQLQVAMYQTQLETIQRNYERFKRLYKKGLVPKAKVEELQMQYLNLKDMVDVAKAQLKEVNNQYKYLVIKAPNNGVITKKMIKVGEMAMPGMPALVLTDLSSLKIRAEIAEGDLKSVKINQKVKVVIPSVGYEKEGKIESIIPSSNPMTHTFMIKVSFKPTKNIYPGMYAKVIIK